MKVYKVLKSNLVSPCDAVAGFRVLFNHPAITHNNDCDCESCKDFALAIRDALKVAVI
jgi:hypothetical protein